jgi:dipeptidyl-peptidase-4
MSANALNHAAADEKRRAVEPADFVRQPSPGNAIPGSLAFSADSRTISYLASEEASLNRVYWTTGVATVQPRVAARAPGGGDTEANLTLAEKLRRERQRSRETGISQIVRARKADVTIVPLKGNLHLVGEKGLERLTSSESPEIDPQLTADGSKIAFVRDDELFVLDLKTRTEAKLTDGSDDGLTHGLAEFAAQEELARSSGFWWSPDGSKIAYQETDERHIPLFTIVREAEKDFGSETHRYPFAGKANAKVKLGVVSATGGPTTWLKLPGLDQGD